MDAPLVRTRRRLAWRTWWALGLLLWGVVAQAVTVLGDAPQEARASYWIDATGQADLAAAQAAFAARQFTPAPTPHRTGNDSRPQWLRIEVEPARAHGDWVLALQSTAIDDVRFFGPFDDAGRALAPPVRTGLVQPYATRPLGLERPAMRLRLDRPGRYVVYMRLQSNTSQSLAVSAWDTAGYVQSRQHKRLFDGVVYGILFTLLVYNLVLAYVFRHVGYGLYVLTCAAALFTLASYNGHLAHYVLGDWPWWQQRANTLGAALWIAFSALLCRNFLEAPRRLPRLDRVLLAVGAAAGLAALLALAGAVAPAHHVLEAAAAVGAAFAVWAAARVWRQGFAPAGWYLGGQGLLFASALAVVGVNWGVIDSPFLLANGLQIGVVAEMLVFAYALSARVRTMLQRQAELRQRADHLEHAAATDALTGVANRLGLSRCAQQLQAAQQPHAVLLLDLDGFKPVNDTHGHEAGDRLLTAVAGRLQQHMRDGDLVARLGGDEFVVLLAGPYTHASLMSLARRLGEAVRVPFTEVGPAISVGVSIGIAASPEHGASLTELLRYADAAMYRAKRGRTGVALHEPGWAQA